MRPTANAIFLVLLCCTLGAVVVYAGRALLAGEVADISPLEISLEENVPCGIGRVSYEEPVITSALIATYTTAALKQGVTGNVRLFAYFDWNGKVSGVAAFKGLSSGLTEEAIKAAKVIKFKPATSCGRAISEPVEIQYDFPSGRSKLVLL